MYCNCCTQSGVELATPRLCLVPMRRCRPALSDTETPPPVQSPVSLERCRCRNVNMKSNSLDSLLLKVEAPENIAFLTYEAEDQRDSRMVRLNWNSENTMKLIETLEKECHELWNMKHVGYKNKAMKQVKYEFLADMFGTTSEEISRKVHNLRTQFNNELRKIRRKQEVGEGGAGGSGWEYFEALSFLKTPIFNDLTPDPLELDSVNLELAEFQADEEETFRKAAARALKEAAPGPSANTAPRRKPMLRVAASAPPPLPPSAHPLMWPEQPVPRLRPSLDADECQIFGDFVASELRTLRSHESRKKLKRMIQKAILKIEEEEDVNIINPT